MIDRTSEKPVNFAENKKPLILLLSAFLQKKLEFPVWRGAATNKRETLTQTNTLNLITYLMYLGTATSFYSKVKKNKFKFVFNVKKNYL